MENKHNHEADSCCEKEEVEEEPVHFINIEDASDEEEKVNEEEVS